MRDINRIDRITEKLNKLWKQSTDLRLCQLISNVAYINGYCDDIFYIEDDKFEKILDEQLKKENKK